MSEPTPSTTCVKCSGRMEIGIIPDKRARPTLFIGPEDLTEWVRGTPKHSLIDGSFRAGGRDRLHIVSLRCVQCGYLELYAPDPGDPRVNPASDATCHRCGYDSTGLPPNAKCPECGNAP